MFRPFKLAVGGEDHTVSFYQGPPFKFVKSSKQHGNFVTAIRYNPKGEVFVSGSTDKRMFLFEGKECGELKELTTGSPHTRSTPFRCYS